MFGKNDSKFVLKKSYSYYSQVQQQLHTVPDRDYCDFVVFAVQNDFVQLIQERITPDNIHWQQQLPKLSLFWRICILPEIMGRWYTRKLNMKTPPAVQVDGDCYCRLKADETTVTCSDISCLSIQKVPKTWYCPHCRKMPEFQLKKKVKNSKVSENLTVLMKMGKICTCGQKAGSADKILKCHNENCPHGAFFSFNMYGIQTISKQCQDNMEVSTLLPICLSQEMCSYDCK